MEVANLTATIAPPIFAQGTEEARKDSQNRETIPQPQQSQDSNKENRAGSEGTSGANSSLYAQSQTLIRNATDQDKNNQEQHRKNRQDKPEIISAQNEITGTQSLNSKGSLSSAYTIAVSSSFIDATPQQNKNFSKTKKLYANFSASVKNKLSDSDQARLSAVTARYNSTAHIAQLGTVYDALV